MLIAFVVIPLFAMAVAFISNMAGLGGGALLVLFFLYYLGLGSVAAGGLSLISIATSSIVGSSSNIRQGQVSIGLFKVLLVFSSIGIVLGSVLSLVVPTDIFKGIFGFIPISVGIASIILILKDRKFKKYTEPKSYFDRGVTSAALVAGTLSGFTGLGIGGITGTYLTSMRRMKPKLVFSTIVFTMIITSMLGGLIHLGSFNFPLDTVQYIPLLMAGAAAGVFIGARVSGIVKSKSLRMFQAVTLIIIGIIAVSIYLVTHI